MLILGRKRAILLIQIQFLVLVNQEWLFKQLAMWTFWMMDTAGGSMARR